MRLAIIDEPQFFVLRQRLSALGLVSGQYHFLHRRGEAEIFGGHVKDAVEHERELFRLAVLVLAHDAEEVILKVVPGDVRKRPHAECRLQIDAEGTLVLLKCGGLGRLLFDFQPVAGVVAEENGLCRADGFGRLLSGFCGRPLIKRCEPVHKALAHGLEVAAGRLDIHPLAADAGLKIAVGSDAVVDDVIVCDKDFSDVFRHGFDLLSGEFEAAFAVFRNRFPVAGEDVHRLFDGRKLPVECHERVVQGG